MASDPQPELSERIEKLRSETYGFDERPLEHFRGLSAEAIEAHEGIGPKYRERIQAALTELDGLLKEAGEPIPEPAEPAAGTADDAYLEPAGGGAGTPVLVLTLVIVIALIIAAFQFGGKQANPELQQKLDQMQNALSNRSLALADISKAAALEARQQALRVYAKTRESNFGEAREHLVHVEALLTTAHNADAVQSIGRDDDRRARVKTAQEALVAARAALSLDEAMTQEQVEAAIDALVDAVAAIQPEPEGVKE